jgi:glycosyltransferase involved in cell wall biosynthesis
MDDLRQDMKNRQIGVCLVSPDAYLLFNPRATGVQGGTEVDFYMISTELAKDKRFRVSIITGDFGQAKIETCGDITIYKATDLRKNIFSGAASLWKAMRLVNADIYFRQGAAITTDIVAMFCRLHHKIFFLRTAHDLECNGWYLKQYPLRGRTYLWSLKQARRVFVQKASDVSNLFGTTGINAIIMPNGHHIAPLQGNQRDCVLWVGRSEKFKQPGLFVRLARENPSEQFVMICQQIKGDNDYQNLVSMAQQTPNLKFLKYVPFHEIDAYFLRAKVYVITSEAEGFPSTFVQAGKCSTPILSLHVNPDGFLDKYHCGICCNGDWTMLTNSLKALSEQSSRYIEMGKNARRYVEENHDIGKIIEVYKKYFIEALAESQKR